MRPLDGTPLPSPGPDDGNGRLVDCLGLVVGVPFMFAFVTFLGFLGALTLWSTFHTVSASIVMSVCLSLVVAAWLWGWTQDVRAVALISLLGSFVSLGGTFIAFRTDGRVVPLGLVFTFFGMFVALNDLAKSGRAITSKGWFGDLVAVYLGLCLLLFVMSGLCGVAATLFGYDMEFVLPWSTMTLSTSM